jgi:KDO2-lipid IV(A) lauroyltransferase
MQLPYEKRVRAMGRIMSRGIGPLTGYRKRAETHLALVYPVQSREERRRLATAVCDNFGRTLIENYSWREFGQRLADTTATGDGLHALEDARTIGKPVIFVTGHIGNHEAPRHVLTQTGLIIGGLYRPMGNSYFNAHYSQTMSSWGGPVFAQGRQGTIGFAKHLKAGGMATLLFDVASSGGVNIPFMGHPARTSTSAADLALRLDAVVIPYFGIRKPDGFGIDVHIEAPIASDTPETMMTIMTERLEARIRATPEQWFWVHRRWKQPKAKN